jgi:hypothetical protein
MRCQQCGKITYHPCYHWPTNRALCRDCYPFVCSRCGTTKTQAIWFRSQTEELCDRCDYLRAGRESRTFGDPGDGKLFTEDPS